MGELTMKTCDHCGKHVENPYAERGWIQFTSNASGANLLTPVNISRSTGVYGPSSYETDYLDRVRDFCGAACLVAALDKKAREREDEKIKSKESGAARSAS
jgi:hypothetical protein